MSSLLKKKNKNSKTNIMIITILVELVTIARKIPRHLCMYWYIICLEESLKTVFENDM